MSDEIRKYLTDILFAISEIESFIGEKKNFNRFRKSALIKAAVERKLEIIGEAMKNALELDGNLPITNARRIVNTRNKIIHGYDEIDEVMLWEIAIKHLPLLKQEVEGLL
jgi:uncharacterized protein with HEPN domain